MRRSGILVAIASTLSAGVAGCARVEIGPSHLGLPVISDAEADENDDDRHTLQQLRYMNSNKVLGAMAYHKITGRTIDPTRLQGSR